MGIQYWATHEIKSNGNEIFLNIQLLYLFAFILIITFLFNLSHIYLPIIISILNIYEAAASFCEQRSTVHAQIIPRYVLHLSATVRL